MHALYRIKGVGLSALALALVFAVAGCFDKTVVGSGDSTTKEPPLPCCVEIDSPTCTPYTPPPVQTCTTDCPLGI